jgi:hypothetical protein
MDQGERPEVSVDLAELLKRASKHGNRTGVLVKTLDRQLASEDTSSTAQNYLDVIRGGAKGAARGTPQGSTLAFLQDAFVASQRLDTETQQAQLPTRMVEFLHGTDELAKRFEAGRPLSLVADWNCFYDYDRPRSFGG